MPEQMNNEALEPTTATPEQVENSSAQTDEMLPVEAGSGQDGQHNGDLVALDKSVVRSAMWRHLITLQWSWNYERMQALGYVYSMLPIINAVYKDKAERITAMKRHLVFYNTNPQVGSPLIFGATVAMEAQREGEAVDSIKVGLMGPLAGIGDTIQAILFRPIIAVIAASLALSGSYFGPLIMFLSGIFWTILMIPLFYAGYKQGIGIAQEVSSQGRLARFTEMVTIMGMVVIGGFVPSIMAKLKTPIKYAQTVTSLGQTHTQTVALQTTLDALIPYLIPVVFVAFAFWLLRGLKLSAVWALIILFIVAFVLGALGWL